jgi:uncharacterized protein YutE (UPF0331/DUF86 family)
MVDKRRLDTILADLQTCVSGLADLASLRQEEFLADEHKVGHARYLFVIAIECCIRAANHVIASERFRPAENSADSFVVLIEEAVLPKEREEDFREMVRFRNRLLHLYWVVDDELVYRRLQERLGDFDDFARGVAKLD